MKTLIFSTLLLCSCVRVPINSDILAKALQSGTVSLLERTSVYSDKSGIIVEETLARNPDGTAVFIKVGDALIPLYDRRCIIVKGIEFPDNVSGTGVPKQPMIVDKTVTGRKPGADPTPAEYVVPAKDTPENVKLPEAAYPVEPLPDNVKPASPVYAGAPLADLPLGQFKMPTPVESVASLEYVQAVEQNQDGTCTVKTDKGNSYTGKVVARTKLDNGIVDVVMYLNGGDGVKLRAGGERAKQLE